MGQAGLFILYFHPGIFCLLLSIFVSFCAIFILCYLPFWDRHFGGWNGHGHRFTAHCRTGTPSASAPMGGERTSSACSTSHQHCRMCVSCLYLPLATVASDRKGGAWQQPACRRAYSVNSYGCEQHDFLLLRSSISSSLLPPSSARPFLLCFLWGISCDLVSDRQTCKQTDSFEKARRTDRHALNIYSAYITYTILYFVAFYVYLVHRHVKGVEQQHI